VSLTGFPPYGSFEHGRFDAVNRYSLNTNFSLPIVTSPGRGYNFKFATNYNSLIWTRSSGVWTPVTDQSGNPTWGWQTKSAVGHTGYVSATIRCRVFNDDGTFGYQFVTVYSAYSYTDPLGTVHYFDISFGANTNCGFDTGPRTGYAIDGSGFYLDATMPASPQVTSPAGVASSGALIDTNGNYVSANVVSSTETDWIDTAGRVALKVITNASNIQYQYLDPTGVYQTATLNLQTFNIKTNFGCSGVVEYTGTASLPVSLVLPNNQSFSFTYEPTPGNPGYYTGRVQRVTLPTGGYYEYDYPGANDSVNCSDGSVTSLNRIINDGITSATWTYSRAQNGSSWTTTVTAPQLPYDTAANQSTFTFDSNAHKTSEKDYQGSATTGTLLRTTSSTWATNGSPATDITILEDNQTQSERETTYDSNGNLLSLKEHDWGAGAPGAVIRTTTYTYLTGSAYTAANILNRVSEITVADSTGQLKSRTDYAYDAPANLNTPCVTGAAQHNDTNFGCSYTTRGLPTSVTTYSDPVTPSGGVTKNFTYDSLGNLRSADADCCQKKQWNYSATTQYAFPDSVVSGASGGPQLTTSNTYNSYTGLKATGTDENNQITSYAYDYMKRPASVTRPDGAQTTYAYNEVARTVTETKPVDSTQKIKETVAYDGLGRTIKTTTADVNANSYSVVETQYDVLSRTWKVSNPHNSTAQYWAETRFDALGRAVKSIAPDNSTTTLSYATNAVTTTDPAGKQRKNVSDGLGRVITVYEPDVTNGNSLTQQTTFTYTVQDAVASVAQGVQTRTFNYDGMSRKTSETIPEAGTTSYQYNSFGLTTQRTDARGVITNYTYDTLNRLAQVSYNVGSTGVPATPQVTYTYGTSAASNNNGRLVTMTDGVGSESYTYDVMGRVTQLQKTISGTVYTTSYAYNYADEETSITYPSGRVVQQSYDPIGRLAAVSNGGTNYASGFAYNTASQVTGVNYGNGVAAAFGYSPNRLQMQSLSYTKASQTLFSLAYAYGPSGSNNGQISGITDNVDAGRTLSFTYDALSRLSTAASQGSANYVQWGVSFTYDRYGNRTAENQTSDTPPFNQVTVNAATNRITGTGYGHDASGNMTGDGSNTLVSDAENRVVSAAGATYSYDGKNLRMKRVSGGTTTVYVFSKGSVIGEYDNGAAPASPSRENIYVNGQLLAALSGATTTYRLPDHLSARIFTDASGNVIGQRGLFPFGEVWYETGTVDKWKFTSYERDTETGNDYALARFYVNRLGRFSATDPASCARDRDPQHLNRYPYVANDPVDQSDPSGLLPIKYAPPDNGETKGTWDCYFWAVAGGIDTNICAGGGGGGSGGGGGGLFSLACPGTTDCGYYFTQCLKVKTVTSQAYYCVGAPITCIFAPTDPFSNCVRLCLQDHDHCLNLPDALFPACTIGLHSFCFARCTTCLL
jgi:RHS repeat-associated protein